MYLGRVVGCVWATVKSPQMDGMRMLVVQPLTADLQKTGKPIICTDCTGAGAGEMVYWVRGKEASFPFLPAEPPTDTTIVGIVDSVDFPSPAPAQSQGARAEHHAAAKRGKSKPC
ncbi:MAG TPA: EutN/CcmL family microcompartment protein [Bryobacteraceae bacterium]|nr:EutN/CcmL family microcompartment protein [Bryobacteraceae bacterium]